MSKETNTIFCKDRKSWRAWLKKNHLLESSIWLVYFKKHTNKLTVSYADAVEEAICFGWIDGQIKKIDDDRYMQRYTPRKKKSKWSVVNIERANTMIKKGLMSKEGLRIFQNGIKNNEIVPSSKRFSIPDDLMSALNKNTKAIVNFNKFAPSAKLAYVYWINTAKTDETRQKRIKKSVELLSQNKKYGET